MRIILKLLQFFVVAVLIVSCSTMALVLNDFDEFQPEKQILTIVK